MLVRVKHSSLLLHKNEVLWIWPQTLATNISLARKKLFPGANALAYFDALLDIDKGFCNINIRIQSYNVFLE